MIAFGLNPGLILLGGALLVLVCTNALRMPIMLAASIGAVALAFTSDFGSYARFAQIGLEITPLRLDPLAQVFGLAVGLATIILVIASSVGRDRWRDGALLAASGGAAGAVFAGDFVSFTAYIETASLAVVALVFCKGGGLARKASIDVLAWQACAGACLAIGAGLIWGETGRNSLEPMALTGPGQGLFLLGILVKAGAVPAHAWLRLSAGTSQGIALAGILTSVPIAALYALIRCFGALEILLPLAAFWAVYAAVLAAGARDDRVRLALVFAALIGLAVLGAIGGGPLGLAGACALAFSLCLGGSLAALALDAKGAGGARVRSMLRGMAALGAASFLSVPGTLGYAATSLLLDGLARDGALGYWLLGLGITIAPVLRVHFGGAVAPAPAGAVDGVEPLAFGTLLAMLCAAFFILVIGMDSRWLYALLPPGQLLYSAYDTAHVLARMQILCGAGLAASLVSQVQRLVFASPSKVRGRSSGDVLDWAVPLCTRVAGFVHAGAAWRAQARLRLEARVLAFAKARFEVLVSSEKSFVGEILGPGMVLVLAAGLALGLFLNAG